MCVKLAKEFELTPIMRKTISAMLEGVIVALTRLGYLEQDRANELIEKLNTDALNVGQLRLLTDVVVTGSLSAATLTRMRLTIFRSCSTICGATTTCLCQKAGKRKGEHVKSRA